MFFQLPLEGTVLSTAVMHKHHSESFWALSTSKARASWHPLLVLEYHLYQSAWVLLQVSVSLNSYNGKNYVLCTKYFSFEADKALMWRQFSEKGVLCTELTLYTLDANIFFSLSSRNITLHFSISNSSALLKLCGSNSYIYLIFKYAFLNSAGPGIVLHSQLSLREVISVWPSQLGKIPHTNGTSLKAWRHAGTEIFFLKS